MLAVNGGVVLALIVSDGERLANPWRHKHDLELIVEQLRIEDYREICQKMAEVYAFGYFVMHCATHVHGCMHMRCSAWVAAREANRMVESDASMPKMIPVEKTCQISH